MRVLISGYHNPNFITITEYVEEAIKNLGHELIVFDDRKHIIPGRIRKRIRWLHEFDLRHINTQFISLALNTNPDVVIVTGDYHHVFCGGTEAQEILEKNGIFDTNWLPFACAPEFHCPIYLSSKEKITPAKDVVFVGSFYPNRWKILKELKEFDLGIWGPNWGKVNCESLDRLSVKSVQLKHTEWIKIFAAAKIAIVLHFQDGITPCYQASPKVYEALACNSFVLVDKQKDVLSLFDDGKHLVSFDSITDLKQKIIYFLNNSDEREKIVAQGHKEVLNKHTYVHRMREMFSIIGS
jgi:glycosyltransferase involved in cell wall biosynthesis